MIDLNNVNIRYLVFRDGMNTSAVVYDSFHEALCALNGFRSYDQQKEEFDNTYEILKIHILNKKTF